VTIRNTAIALLAGFALAGIALAHEGHHHDAMGTIEALDAEHIVLQITADTSEQFALSQDTIFTRGTEAVASEDAEVGERAVVIYETKDGHNVALEVELAAKDSETHDT
jgi:hypothetical protein